MKRNFNKIFWEIWGVNQRVYTYQDVFRVKNSFTNSYKKRLSNFLKKINIRNSSFIEVLYEEPNQFYLLFKYLIFTDTKGINIQLIKEINNITFTYRFIDILELKITKIKLINLFAFQIALILEKIENENIDTSLFNQSLKETSFKPIIESYKKRTNKNQNGVASDLHDNYYSFLELLNKHYSSKIKEINSTDVLINDISSWMNGEIPEFTKIVIIGEVT